MWCHVARWVATNSTMDCNAFIFKVKQSKNTLWRWRHYMFFLWSDYQPNWTHTRGQSQKVTPDLSQTWHPTNYSLHLDHLRKCQCYESWSVTTPVFNSLFSSLVSKVQI
jgi:hypothetical protein